MLKMLLIMLALFCAAIAIPVVIVRMLRRIKEKRK